MQNFFIGLAVVVTLFLVFDGQRRLRVMEAKLDMMLALQGWPECPMGEPSPEVLQLAAEGQRIAALRLHRQQTGASLKDAQDAIDRHLALQPAAPA